MTNEEEKAIRELIKKFAYESLVDAHDAMKHYEKENIRDDYTELHMNLALRIFDKRWDVFIMDAKGISQKDAVQRAGLGSLLEAFM